MSDETLSPDHELASAYVDGQASAPERAQVEASPELIALVTSLREQRAALAAVAPVSDTVREAAVAAALAEFDALLAAGPGASRQVAAVAAIPAAPQAPPTNVVSIERHRRWNRVLGAAAAVAAVGLVGVGVASIGSGSSDDSASFASVQTESADSLSGGADTSKIGVAGNATDPTNLAPTGPSPDTTAGSTGTIGSIDAGGSAVPSLADTSSLRELPEPKTAVAPSFVLDCSITSDQEILAEITWRGTPAVVVRDTVTGVITVLDAQCNTLVTVDN